MSSSTRIRSISLYKIFISLKEPFVISLGPINEVQNLVVRITTEGGLVGFGECSPYMSINGESIDTCYIVGGYFAKVLRGKNAADIEERHADMDGVIYGNTSVKSAFDMALYDIAAQAAGQPLYEFLGGKAVRELETDMTVSIGSPEKMAADARRFVGEGFGQIKMKLGTQPEADEARIRAVREAIGQAARLKVDANQGWGTPEVAIEALNRLAPFDIDYCEEPISRWRFMELRRVREASPIPIMADESCGDEHDAERLVQLGACGMINIKLGKSSGLMRGQRIAELGAEHGLELQVGGFMESRLGMTAAAHLVLANSAIHHCDFDTPLMYTEDPVAGGLIYEPGGRLHMPQKTGLGAVINPSFLNKAEQIHYD